VRQDIPHSLLGYVKFAVVKLASLGVKLPLEPLFGYEDLTTGIGGALLGAERTQTGFGMQLLRERPLAAAVLALVGLAVVAGLAWALRRHWRRLGALRPLVFLWPALLGAALFYPLYLLNYSMRHFYPYSVGLAVVWGALLAGVAEGAWFKQRGARIAAGAMLAVLLAAPGARAWTTDASPRHAWDLVRTIEQNVPTGAKIGYTDCGVFGYYLPRYTVVNLDGILNFEALREMQHGDIGAYLQRHDVQYVLRLHNFEAEYSEQWKQNVAPTVEATSVDWICRLKAGG
jgi:hypothetical protein